MPSRIIQKATDMKSRALIWALILLSLITSLSACFFPVRSDNDHHGGGDYQEHREVMQLAVLLQSKVLFAIRTNLSEY